jgi:hypothetical protein
MDSEDYQVRKLSDPKPFFLILFLACSVFQSGSFAQTRLLADPGTTLIARFGSVPAPGVHPRVLIGPKELASLRQLMQTTEVGKYTATRLESFLAVIHTPGKDLAATYEGLMKGDRNALTYAKTPWWQGKVSLALLYESYDAMLREDRERGQQVGAALATLASIWSSKDVDVFNLAIAYDFDYAYMSEEQRRIVRQTIATMTAGKQVYGADVPADWRNYNWMPGGTTLMLSALAIEGEQGYDASIYPATRQVMRDFLHYGITQAGGPLEEMHYFHFGMTYGALALVAFARHGDNLFSEPHYRALPNWLVASMEPYGDAFSTHQDTPNDQGGAGANYTILKWIWPNDPVVGMVWRNWVGTNATGLNYYGNWPSLLLFPSDPAGWRPFTGPSPLKPWGLNEPAIPANYPDAVQGIETLKLPLTYWDPERGLLITRNKWGSEGMVLHVDMNTVANVAPGHAHANSGIFTLSALRRKWAIDRGFHISETKDSSLILIDGRGQGFFPVGGETVERREEPNLTVIAGDESEPYHWMKESQIRTGNAALSGFRWQPEKRAETIRRWDEVSGANNPQPWNDKVHGNQYPYVATYNPVEKAFRTAALRRNGSHDYVLIVDDIKKDAGSHQYDWLMQTPDDLMIKSNNGGAVVLGSSDPKDNRRLLVQMIGANGGGSWVFEAYEVKRSPETLDTSSFGTGHRLRYTVRAVEPGFRVLLYPYREGEALPQISANGPLEVRWPDQRDVYDLSALPTGRTELRMRP